MDGKRGEFLEGKVVRKHKKNSINRNIIGIQFDDGSNIDVDFPKDVTAWFDAKDIIEHDDHCCLHSFSTEKDILHDCFATILTREQVKKRPEEAEHAMKQEIKKFEDFKAFKVVKDEGQYAIKTRWVFTEHNDESKGYNLKSRLCMRGDREQNKDEIRVDSPTAHKDSLKLALAITANEGFDLVSADIKSAFLQGKTLERKVFVVPPTEAKQNGKLWLLEKGAYGLVDGSRLFYLQIKWKNWV